jgi:uncharacterized membrane protein
MGTFWDGFEKRASKAEQEKERLPGSLAGTILGAAGGTLLANKAYGAGSHFWTPVAGAVVGNRLGALLNDKVRKEAK